MDMASFAVNAQHLINHPNAVFPHLSQNNYESIFLQELVTWDELEPKANNCSRVKIVFHSFICLFKLITFLF